MKSRSLWKASVAVNPESEEAISHLLELVFGETACIVSDPEGARITASVYLDTKSECTAERRDQLLLGLSQLAQEGLDVRQSKLALTRIRREDWAESWKKHFKPFDVGRSLLVKPSWSGCKPRAGQKVVILDPGLSFGTGQHPTTRFCLDQIAAFRESLPPQSFLDAGTGSGILAIAAAKLGYKPVDAFDFDPEAVRIARRNAKRNRVDRQVRVRHCDLARLAVNQVRRYDLVCANLTRDLLVEHRAKLTSLISEGGRLVLAGILGSQFDAVAECFAGEGLELTKRSSPGEWTSGVFGSRRPAAARQHAQMTKRSEL
jgi:ribosomal protein L11 methyltransferase